MDGPTKIREWAGFLKAIRHFLDERGYFEVTTNLMVPVGAFESTLDCLQVTWSRGRAELNTSPEIEMKRILAQTQESIYQVCRSFRDDPDTPIHRLEFSMLEFYRRGYSSAELLAETFSLIAHLAEPDALHEKIYSLPQLLTEKTGIDLEAVADRDTFYAAAKKAGNRSVATSDTWEDIFFKLVLDEIETALPGETPTALIDYPVTVSPLSKPGPGGRYAERFEIYWHGMEIANGCTELWSAEELKRRYEKESHAREAVGKKRHPYPRTLIEAAQRDVGPVAGVAIGLERLFLALEKHRALSRA